MVIEEPRNTRKIFSRVEHVDRVEIFMQASRSYSSIIYSGSSIEGSDTFGLYKPPDYDGAKHVLWFIYGLSILLPLGLVPTPANQFLRYNSQSAALYHLYREVLSNISASPCCHIDNRGSS